jgi:hypothetical protein
MRRRSTIALTGMTTVAALAGVLDTNRVQLQQPAAPAPPTAAQAAPQAAKFEFVSQAGLVLSPIKPDRTAVYEEVIAKVKQALAASTDPVRKQQAAAWKVYRADEPYQNNTLYVSVLDPAVKGADYGVYPLLLEFLGEAPARELFEKYRDAHAGGQHILQLTRVTGG